MNTWPLTLPPTFDQDSFNEQDQDTVIRTQMEAGPAKVRNRFTAGVVNLQGSMLMTKDQTQILDDFYKTNKALAFTFTHPRTGVAVSVRFTAPPTKIPYQQQWRAGIQFEVLP